DLQNFGVGKLVHAAVERNIQRGHDVMRALLADAVDVLESDHNTLRGRNIYASNSGHVLFSVDGAGRPLVLSACTAIPMRKNDAALRPKGWHRCENTDRGRISMHLRPPRQPRLALRRAGFSADFRAFTRPRLAARRFTWARLRALAFLRTALAFFLVFRFALRAR